MEEEVNLLFVVSRTIYVGAFVSNKSFGGVPIVDGLWQRLNLWLLATHTGDLLLPTHIKPHDCTVRFTKEIPPNFPID
jgi:hypothetical protein